MPLAYGILTISPCQWRNKEMDQPIFADLRSWPRASSGVPEQEARDRRELFLEWMDGLIAWQQL
jgi:hypothetical protein